MSLFSVFEGKRVLLTGHTGFQGFMVESLVADLWSQLFCISNNIPSEPSHFKAAGLSSYVKDLRIDLRDSNEVAKSICKIQPDFVFHLAAQPLVRLSYECPADTWQINTIGTINILEALRN